MLAVQGVWKRSEVNKYFKDQLTVLESYSIQDTWVMGTVLDWLIEDILQAPSTMSGDLRA